MLIVWLFLLIGGSLSGTIAAADLRLEVMECDCLKNSSKCELEVAVNYKIQGQEFSVQFDCSKEPVFNQHSVRVFQSVKRYKLDGCRASGGDLGLRYLSFPENVEYIELSNYCLEELEGNTFSNFSNLKQLKLRSNVVQWMSEGSFGGLDKLKVIEIENVTIGEMNPHVMEDLSSVTNVSVINSELTMFGINGLKSLKTINVINSSFTNLEGILAKIAEQIEFINITSVRRSLPVTLEISESYVNFHLERLVLEDIKLHKIRICNLTNLYFLKLSNNQLSESTAYFCELQNLKLLDISHNQFTSFSRSNLNKCDNLVSLNLAENQIQLFDSSLFDPLYNLEYLNLSNNQLRSIQFQPSLNHLSIQADGNPFDCVWLHQLIQYQPESFIKLKYTVTHNGLAVQGLPCEVPLVTANPTENTSSPISTPLNAPHFPLGLIPPYPTTASVEPYTVHPRWKILLVTIATGVWISHVVFMLYNKYRRNHYQPFYRRLPKDTNPMLVLNSRYTITTRTDSILYEQPVRGAGEDDHQERSGNIYEEIPEDRQRRQEPTYDRLQFHRFDIDGEDMIDV